MTELQKLKAELEQLKAENRQLIEEITWLPDNEYGNVLTQLDNQALINTLETQRLENINWMIVEMPFWDFTDYDDLTFDTVASIYDQIYNMEG